MAQFDHFDIVFGEMIILVSFRRFINLSHKIGLWVDINRLSATVVKELSVFGLCVSD